MVTTLNARDRALREAYWAHSDRYEFHNLSDSCQEFLALDPTEDQLKTLFMLLPEDIVGSGLNHGFTDSVVRDDVYEFIRDHAEFLRTKLTE